MYQKVENSQPMTDNEVCEHYPDDYALVRWDSMDSEEGTVLYVSDNMGELMKLANTTLEDEPYCGVVEGLNLQRSLGGVVVGG